MTTLVLTARHAADDQALWRAAVRRGWSTVRVQGIRVPMIDDEDRVVYAEALFAPTIAERLGRRLLDPPDDWLVRLPHALRHRDVALTTLGAARARATPAFVKPPNDKTFAARIYARGADLPGDYDDATPVLVAQPVRWRSEYRCFCLDQEVLAASPYVVDGQAAVHLDYAVAPSALAEARRFAREVLVASGERSPRALVIDVGTLDDGRWSVVEANGAWGAGIYGCDPDAVLDVIRHATVRADR